MAKCPILAFGKFYIWWIAHNYDAIVGLFKRPMVPTFKIVIAAFVGIMLTVQDGHPLSANTSAVNDLKIANTEDPYPVAVPSA